jgi:xylan 1,4-beta-xylosidase
MEGSRVAVSGGTGYDAPAIRAESVRGLPDVNGFAARSDRTATVLVWNYHDDDLPAPATPVSINVSGLPDGPVLMHHYRIDREHSNAYEAWKALGSPRRPSPEQYAALERAGQLELYASPAWIEPVDGDAKIELLLPRQGVSLVRFSW